MNTNTLMIVIGSILFVSIMACIAYIHYTNKKILIVKRKMSEYFQTLQSNLKKHITDELKSSGKVYNINNFSKEFESILENLRSQEEDNNK